MKKYVLYTSLIAAGIIAISLASFPTTSTIPERMFVNNGGPISLGAAEFSNLSTEFGDGTFNSYTSAGAPITWKYHNAKKSGSNLILGKTEHGNATFSDNYIGNTLPITTTSRITINFSGARYMRVYGGLNPEDDSSFYYVGLLDREAEEPVFSTTAANSYYFYRFVNNDHYKAECVISSIEIEYSCADDDRSDNSAVRSSKSDATQHIHTGKTSPSYNSENVYDSRYSEQSVLINAAAGTTQYYFDLPNVIPVGESGNYGVEIHMYLSNPYINTDASNNNRNAPYFKATSNTNSLSIEMNFSYVTTLGNWTKLTMAMPSGNTSVIDGLRFNAKRAGTGDSFMLVGGLRTYLLNSYPAYNPPVDADDLAVASNVVYPPYKNGDGYAPTDDLDVIYNDNVLVTSTSAVRFTAAKIETSYSTTSIGVGSNDISDSVVQSKTVEFFVNFAHAKGTNGANPSTIELAHANGLKVALGHTIGSEVYLTSTITSNPGHVESMGDGWYKYNFTVSDFGTELTYKTKTTTDFTFLYLQLYSSSIAQSDIDYGAYFVVDRLSIA